MYQSLCILGRQSGIARAELESLFGAENVRPNGHNAALICSTPQEVRFDRLGGTIKLAKVITELPTSNWQAIVSHITTNVPKHLAGLPEGKIKFGLSVYGSTVKTSAINAAALEVKKETKALGRSIRVVPNNEPFLSSAQVLHNKLTKPMGIEMIVLINGQKTILAITKYVQDIDAYAARDQKRPMRDARVGMLPPKLAQIIINLADPPARSTVLDPFCGTGVILQEALLMGFHVIGSDIDQRMTQYTTKNLEWLIQQPHYRIKDEYFRGLSTNDATKILISDFSNLYIAAETYLGRPFSAEPNQEKLSEVIHDINMIHKKFLENIARQTKPGFRMCIAVPAWHTNIGIKHLPILDQLTDMGYTRMSFVHAKNEELIYHREGQIVGRELVVLIRK